MFFVFYFAISCCDICYLWGLSLGSGRYQAGSVHSPGGDGCKWKGYLCASSINTHGKKNNNKMLETCLAVRPQSPFNIVVLGPLPATLYVCFSDGAQTVIIVIPGGKQSSERNI